MNTYLVLYTTQTHTRRGEEAQETAPVVDAMWETKKKTRQERVGSVTANPDNLEIRKEAGGGAKGTQGLSKHCKRKDVPFVAS